MPTTHHLQYVNGPQGLTFPQHHALRAQLADATLAVGDKLVMTDGQLLARVVASLTDFDDTLTASQAKELTASPALVLCHRGEHHTLSFKKRVYAERTVITVDGAMAKQYLTRAFGELVWVNLGHRDVLMAAWDYEQQRNQIQ